MVLPSFSLARLGLPCSAGLQTSVKSGRHGGHDARVAVAAPHFESLPDRARAPMTTGCTGGTAELAEAPAFAVACNIFGVGAA